jgi:hypothetical protein
MTAMHDGGRTIATIDDFDTADLIDRAIVQWPPRVANWLRGTDF